MKGTVVAIVIIVILGALGYFFYVSNQTKTEEPAATTKTESQVPTTPSGEKATQPDKSSGGSTVTYTDSGFNPQSLTIKSGETITWVNNSNGTLQIGSDNHPDHTINRELTGGEFIIELAKGESRSVQLTKNGEWGYHNHKNPGTTGTIVVE